MKQELLSQRTENGKTFDLGEGKRQLVTHIGDVHYKDNYANKSEPWKDIDLTWEGNRITKAPYELTHEGNKLTLKNKRTGKIITIELDSIGGKKIPDVAWERSKGLAKIPDIALDTDLEVIAEFCAVRFRRVLKSDKAPKEAKFKITGDTNLIKIRASDVDRDIPVESSLENGILTETLKPDREVKYPVRIDPTWQVGDNSDDCTMRGSDGYFRLDYEYLRAGQTDELRNYGAGLRFTNVTIPKGSTIDQAYLTLRASIDRDVTVVNLQISAEDVDDAPTFTDSGEAFNARYANHTTAIMDWNNIGAWVENTNYNSPTTDGVVTFASIIQEIIDRGGWNSGQDIVIFWEDFGDRSDHNSICWRQAISYEGNPTYAPKLVIDYTPPVVGWTGKISGVTNPAKIMGVDVANIHSVKGVESA